MLIDKRILNLVVIFVLTLLSFVWTFFIFHQKIDLTIILSVFSVRVVSSLLIYKDYSLSWSKVSQKTFLIKSFVYIVAFLVYLPFFYGEVRFAFLVSELFLYLFMINFLMYAYYSYFNRALVKKSKSVVIFGAGKAGLKLAQEFKDSMYEVRFFIDDDKELQKRSIDGKKIISKEKLKNDSNSSKYDLLVIAIPSAKKAYISAIYNELHDYFEEIQILPSMDEILNDKQYSAQLKDISVEDLLARHPKDLDKSAISSFIIGKTILVTGAGGSIGSEIVRQCITFKAKKIILLDHSEYNLYALMEELQGTDVTLIPVMESVTNASFESIFKRENIDIVIHAAAYKHVPLVEANINKAIQNNVFGTKQCIDFAIKYGVKKFILISTDKAVRPTNVMGTTKRICELYAQNVAPQNTEIVAVRFGNVLGSSGSVIPKFKAQIEKGGPITVTHPDITRYFMLIPEACELVLQAGAIGKGGEIFILDMGEPIKIVDLAKKMIELSGKKEIDIVYSGLRPGEKLYEELLINDTDEKTSYESITVAKPSVYQIDKLDEAINELLISNDPLRKLKEIVPEFDHKLNSEKG